MILSPETLMVPNFPTDAEAAKLAEAEAAKLAGLLGFARGSGRHPGGGN